MVTVRSGKLRRSWWVKPQTSDRINEFAARANCYFNKKPSAGDLLDLVAKGTIAEVGDNWVIVFPKE